MWVLFVASVIGGAGIGAAQTALFAAIVDTVEHRHVGRAMGWLTFSMQAGFLIGPASAGVLLAAVSVQQDLWIVGAFWLTALALSFFVPGGARPASWRFEVVTELIRRPGFQAVLLGTLAVGMVWGTIQGYLPIFGVQGLRLPGSQVGLLLAVQAAVNGASRLVAGRLTDRLRRQWPLVVAGTAFTSLAVIVLPRVTGFGPAVVVLGLSVPFTALAFIALSVSYANLSTDKNRGLVMGFYSSALFVGLGLGPAAYGPAMQSSYVEGFTLCGLVGLAMAALVPAVRWAPRRARSVVLPPAA